MVVEKDKTEECYRILEAEANKLIESGADKIIKNLDLE